MGGFTDTYAATVLKHAPQSKCEEWEYVAEQRLRHMWRHNQPDELTIIQKHNAHDLLGWTVETAAPETPHAPLRRGLGTQDTFEMAVEELDSTEYETAIIRKFSTQWRREILRTIADERRHSGLNPEAYVAAAIADTTENPAAVLGNAIGVSTETAEWIVDGMRRTVSDTQDAEDAVDGFQPDCTASHSESEQDATGLSYGRVSDVEGGRTSTTS